MAKKGKPIIVVGTLALIANFHKWINLPMGDLVRGLYYLEANWDDCFITGTRENEAMNIFVPSAEEQRRFKQFVYYVLPQAERAGRVLYANHEDERYWLTGMNQLFVSQGLGEFPPSEWKVENFAWALRKRLPGFKVFA